MATPKRAIAAKTMNATDTFVTNTFVTNNFVTSDFVTNNFVTNIFVTDNLVTDDQQETGLRTQIIEIDAESAGPEAIASAAEAITAGKVVAIPTDTLYVLVADPFNLKAVSSVFQVKGRESHRSLPILVTSLLMAEPRPLPQITLLRGHGPFLSKLIHRQAGLDDGS